MRLLKCNECGQQFKTAQKSYTPKYCSKPCYWKASRTPETMQYEQYQALRKNVQYVVSTLLPIIVVTAVIAITVMYLIRS